MDTFLLWSWKHNGWWGPGERGYVPSWKQAGRYPLDRCVQICLRSNTTGFNTSIVPMGPVIPDREDVPFVARHLAGERTYAQDEASDQAQISRAFTEIPNQVIDAVERAKSLKMAAGQASPDYDIGYQTAKRDVLIELAKEFAK